MQPARTLAELLRFYPFEDAEVISTLPVDHWFNIHFSLLTRAPLRGELYMEIPPVGLLSGHEAVDGNRAGPSGSGPIQNEGQPIHMMEEPRREGNSVASTSGKPCLEHYRSRT